MAKNTCFDLGYTPAEEGDRKRRALKKVKDLTLDNGFLGRLQVGQDSVEVRIEPGDVLRVKHEVATPPSPREAMETNLRLPGNLRFAMAGEMILTADTRLDGEVHLCDSFHEIALGFGNALFGRRRTDRRNMEAVTEKDVQIALEGTPWEEDAVVQLDSGWEVRPRVRGDATPVRLAVDGRQLRIGRIVVEDCRGEHERAVAFQALCCNARLRHARLAFRGQAVVAEACLHRGVVNAEWLTLAVRAVATASRHARSTLEILARQSDVAKQFERMFLAES